MVQLSDAQIYSKVSETALTLKKHGTLYNEFLGEVPVLYFSLLLETES